jgi:hypothetical protein
MFLLKTRKTSQYDKILSLLAGGVGFQEASWELSYARLVCLFRELNISFWITLFSKWYLTQPVSRAVCLVPRPEPKLAKALCTFWLSGEELRHFSKRNFCRSEGHNLLFTWQWLICHVNGNWGNISFAKEKNHALTGWRDWDFTFTWHGPCLRMWRSWRKMSKMGEKEALFES